MTTSRRLAVIAAMGLGLVAGTLQAQDFEKRVDLHGFGGWRYGKTDVPNDYLGGTKDGDYREADFALNTSARVSEHLRMVSQVDWHESKAENGVDLEYAFAEWKFSDKLLLRAGKVKQPFGLYSEVFQVGTLRPFLSLPQGVYGPSSIIGLSYKGLGLTGAIRLGKRWGIQYDVYGGGTDLDETIAPEAFLREGTAGAVEPIEREQTRNVIGGRISFETPVEGLRFGGAAFSGIEIGAARRTVAGVHAEYVSNKLSLRSEYAHENVKDDLIVSGFYAEAAYRFDRRWQAAVQYDHLTTELPGADVSIAPSLLDHKEFAVGLNYWFHPEFVLKASYHRVDGNRFALPEPALLDAAVAEGTLTPKTNLFLFGAQLSF